MTDNTKDISTEINPEMDPKKLKEIMEKGEQRRFLRLPFEKPLKFKVCKEGFLDELRLGSSENVSQNGMLFRTDKIPPLGSVVLIETDMKTLSNCIEVENALIEVNAMILGKVVWVLKSKEDNGYHVGIKFFRKGEESEADIEEAINLASS